MNYKKIKLTFLSIVLVALVSGCAGSQSGNVSVPDYYESVDIFNEKLKTLMDKLSDSQKYRTVEFSPVAVVPGSIRKDARYTRLEEYIIEKLEIELRKNHELYTLSRGNWMEFRERRPLSFKDQPNKMKQMLKNLVLFEVRISPDRYLDQANVSILATDSKGNSIAGLGADVALDFYPRSPGSRMYHEAPQNSVYPEGLEERPYKSIDRLAFSLADELKRNYKNGFSIKDDSIQDDEINVLLYTKPGTNVSDDLFNLITGTMQQAIVSESGFKCALSQEDFSSVLDQMNFYDDNADIFDVQKYPLNMGTVLMIMEMTPHKDNNKLGVTLRSLWRTQPLETENGKLIVSNMAGSYVSGFTAKAYLSVDPDSLRYNPRRPASRRDRGNNNSNYNQGFE